MAKVHEKKGFDWRGAIEKVFLATIIFLIGAFANKWWFAQGREAGYWVEANSAAMPPQSTSEFGDFLGMLSLHKSWVPGPSESVPAQRGLRELPMTGFPGKLDSDYAMRLMGLASGLHMAHVSIQIENVSADPVTDLQVTIGDVAIPLEVALPDGYVTVAERNAVRVEANARRDSINILSLPALRSHKTLRVDAYYVSTADLTQPGALETISVTATNGAVRKIDPRGLLPAPRDLLVGALASLLSFMIFYTLLGLYLRRNNYVLTIGPADSEKAD